MEISKNAPRMKEKGDWLHIELFNKYIFYLYKFHFANEYNQVANNKNHQRHPSHLISIGIPIIIINNSSIYTALLESSASSLPPSPNANALDTIIITEHWQSHVLSKKPHKKFCCTKDELKAAMMIRTKVRWRLHSVTVYYHIKSKEMKWNSFANLIEVSFLFLEWWGRLV